MLTSSVLQNVEKAILKSDLGFTPNVDGNIMRINVPQLTQVSLWPLCLRAACATASSQMLILRHSGAEKGAGKDGVQAG